MISPLLDPKVLLGFKLIPLSPSKPGAAIVIEHGAKGVGIKLGAKVGGKQVTKGISLAPRG